MRRFPPPPFVLVACDHELCSETTTATGKGALQTVDVSVRLIRGAYDHEGAG